MVEFTQVVFDFIRQYGFLALFIYMLLETAMILHFAPSELVIPFAAAILVTGPLTFGLFVLVATLGSTLGALFVYYIFDRYGVRAIDRYGNYVHIDREDLDRSQRWFGRWGENSVFWGRLLPVLRAAISIPAGLAEMSVRKFTVYSVLGSLVFNTVLTYLTASGGNAKSPLELFTEWLVANSETAAYVSANRLRVALQLLVVIVLATLVWRRRAWIRSYPEEAKNVTVRAVFWVAVTSGLLLITTGYYILREAFPLITWVWNDPQFIVSGLGVSRQVALLLSGVASSSARVSYSYSADASTSTTGVLRRDFERWRTLSDPLSLRLGQIFGRWFSTGGSSLRKSLAHDRCAAPPNGRDAKMVR